MTAVDGAGNRGQIFFTNKRHRRDLHHLTNNGAAADFVGGGETAFFNTSTAADGTFVNKGATGPRSGGGTTVFHDSSSAGNANFTNSAGAGTSTSATIFLNTSSAADGFFTNDGGGSVTGGTFKEGGQTIFFNTSTAATGTFVNNGATASGGFGGDTIFDDGSSAGQWHLHQQRSVLLVGGSCARRRSLHSSLAPQPAAMAPLFNNAAPASGCRGRHYRIWVGFSSISSPSAEVAPSLTMVPLSAGAVGGMTLFKNTSTADAATLIANGGTNGGDGGAIFFEEKSTGGTPRIEVFRQWISGHKRSLGSCGYNDRFDCR
jgi:hypothetical protein